MATYFFNSFYNWGVTFKMGIMTDKTYKIVKYSLTSQNGLQIDTVVAKPIIIANVKCFVWNEHNAEEIELYGNEWNVSHAETGMNITKAFLKKNAISEAERKLSGINAIDVLNEAKETLIKKGITIPLNT